MIRQSLWDWRKLEGEKMGEQKIDFRRYDRALIRNLHEIHRAILNKRAISGMEAAETWHAIDFFRLAYFALINDMFTHCMKVLDKHKQSVSFWYLYNTDPDIVDLFVGKSCLDWELLCSISEKLKNIRNKTHLHIDKKKVFNPSLVWKENGIKPKELHKVMEMLWGILQHLYFKRFGQEYAELTLDYDGTDATRIMKTAENAGFWKTND